MTLIQQHHDKRVQNKREHGFTLIEIMTVTTILGIVSAFAVPNLQGAKISSNESGVVGSLRSLGTSSELWRTRYGTYPGAFGGDGLAIMSDPAVQPAPFVDNILGSGQKSSYLFVYAGAPTAWSCTATPMDAGAGFRSFFIDETGLIRVETDFVTNGAATAAHPALN